MVHIFGCSKDYPQVSVCFVYVFIHMFTCSMITSRSFSLVYFLYFYCFVSSIHGISCWVHFEANVKVFAHLIMGTGD